MLCKPHPTLRFGWATGRTQRCYVNPPDAPLWVGYGERNDACKPHPTLRFGWATRRTQRCYVNPPDAPLWVGYGSKSFSYGGWGNPRHSGLRSYPVFLETSVRGNPGCLDTIRIQLDRQTAKWFRDNESKLRLFAIYSPLSMNDRSYSTGAWGTGGRDFDNYELRIRVRRILLLLIHA